MSKLASIPIRVEFDRPKQRNIEIAQQVLRDIHSALSNFHSGGQVCAIDLKQRPRMSAETYQYLRDTLSTGEVSAVVDAHVRIDVLETQFPGVWWVCHRNEQDEISTEIIEITEIPAILKPHAIDVLAGLQRLQITIQDSNTVDAVPPGIG